MDRRGVRRGPQRKGGRRSGRHQRRIRAWAADKGLVIAWGRGRTLGTYYPNLDHAGVTYPTFGVFTSGNIELGFNNYRNHPPFDDIAKRRQLLERLNDIPRVSVSDERLETWTNVPLLALSGTDALSQFFQTWEWYIDQLRQSATHQP